MQIEPKVRYADRLLLFPMNNPDWTWMERALKLAERGRGSVEPNPLVGAVIVQGNSIVGEGWHERYGETHAEVNALSAAGSAARGGTLYVTLEPCCHQGKTPPCTDAVIAAGIRRVVAAMTDPFAEVNGKGVRQLRAAGIAVDVGLGELQARRLNAPYVKLTATGWPYVHAKWAMTLDGKIATRSGDSKWITSEASRQRAHAIRGRMDAIVIGGETARADDPLLTVRPPGPRTPVRVILSSSGNIPRHLQLVQSAHEVPTLIFASEFAEGKSLQELEDLGCCVLRIPRSEPADAVSAVLDELGRRRFTNVLIEGGSRTLGGFFDAGAIDEVHVFIAPRLVGAEKGLTPIGGRGVTRIIDALALCESNVEKIGEDVYVHGWMRNATSD
jgi:diaminohydroxyphosphoribosylaminopyrimidine deaminase/5-amino-6-(5-phosphoribosylamino)uracil reductase